MRLYSLFFLSFVVLIWLPANHSYANGSLIDYDVRLMADHFPGHQRSLRLVTRDLARAAGASEPQDVDFLSSQMLTAVDTSHSLWASNLLSTTDWTPGTSTALFVASIINRELTSHTVFQYPTTYALTLNQGHVDGLITSLLFHRDDTINQLKKHESRETSQLVDFLTRDASTTEMVMLKSRAYDLLDESKHIGATDARVIITGYLNQTVDEDFVQKMMAKRHRALLLSFILNNARTQYYHQAVKGMVNSLRSFEFTSASVEGRDSREELIKSITAMTVEHYCESDREIRDFTFNTLFNGGIQTRMKPHKTWLLYQALILAYIANHSYYEIQFVVNASKSDLRQTLSNFDMITKFGDAKPAPGP